MPIGAVDSIKVKGLLVGKTVTIATGGGEVKLEVPGGQDPKGFAEQFENARAVSWKSVIPPHSESTLHRHDRFRTVIGIVGGDLTTVSPDGHKTVTRYEAGKAYWQAPMPPGEMHKDVNDTDKTIELVVVENK